MASTTPTTKAGDVKDMVRELFVTKKYSDMGIYCRGKFWDIHQSVVCMRSDVLETFCVKAGRQSQGKLHIDLSDYECEIISSVLEYAYLDQYEYTGEERVVFHTKMFIAACKFNMIGLQQMAISKYQIAADGLFIEGEWEKCFCESAGLLWTQLEDGEGRVLKDVAVRVAQRSIKLLLESEGGEFRKLGLGIPAIGMAVLEAVVGFKKGVHLVIETESNAVDVLDESPDSSVFHTDIEEEKPTKSKNASPPLKVQGNWLDNWTNRGSKLGMPSSPDDVTEVPQVWEPYVFSVPKKEKSALEIFDEPPMAEIAEEPIIEPTVPKDYDWDSPVSPPKKDKKKKESAVIMEKEPFPEIVLESVPDYSTEYETEPLPETEDTPVVEESSWGSFPPIPSKSKKDKKKSGYY